MIIIIIDGINNSSDEGHARNHSLSVAKTRKNAKITRQETACNNE